MTEPSNEVRILAGWCEDSTPRRPAQSRLARAMLRILLADMTGREGWRIEADCDGRPLAVTPDGNPGPDISIAHSGRVVVVAAVRTGRIGIDVEVPRPGRDWPAIAEAYLPECRHAAATGDEAACLAHWTLREAVAKAAGGGLARALALDGATLAAARNGTAVLTIDGRPGITAHRACGPVQVAAAWLEPSEASALGDALSALKMEGGERIVG